MMMMPGWTHPSTTPAIVVAWLVVGAPCHAQAPNRSPQDLQQALQQRYELVLDFSADFMHTYEGGMLRTRLVERGTILVKRPGRMRWDYREPERKLFVSDGER
ncbi:MAG TPA: outer membrane lipoprotein carrier protein LolA, partial [Acidobacteria bacterium]|nr:outer membrane lipoprotein carrier protein LolA [Acidobacteriota bacterium]